MSQRKIILNLCCTIDAFIEGSQGEIDWCFTDQDYGMTQFLSQVDTIFFGRKSYEQLLEMAPKAFPKKQKIVFSRTLKSDNKVRVISGDLEKEISKILEEAGKDIWLFGGAGLITDMLNLNLIDEMMIAVHPLILGEGKSLFQDISTRKELELIDNITYSSGLVQLIYRLKK